MAELSTAMIVQALDGLAMRSAVTAANIANANTPSYRPLRVSFEEALAGAALRGIDEVRGIRAEVDYASRSEMRLDLELAAAASTAMRYSALIELLGRQLQLRAAAVNGGQ